MLDISTAPMPELPETYTIFDLPIHIVDDYATWLLNRLQQGRGTHVVTLNAEMSMQGRQNPELARIIQQAELVIPDGSGIVLYLRWRGRQVQRCPGIELAEVLIQRSPSPFPHLDQPFTLFFYGGAPGVAQAAADRWRTELPNVAIAGVQHGYISAEEHTALCQRLNDHQPDIILVGLGVPRQEFWIHEHRSLCPNAIWVGVGGSFDIWSGTKTRAPEWLRNHHLEWTYRLYKEPWRWRRMLALPQFAWAAFWEG